MIDFLNHLVSLALEAIQPGNAGVIALFLVAALTEVGVPFPFVMDTVLFIAGYAGLSLHAVILMLVLMLGREAGAFLIYLLSRLCSKPFVGWLERRFKYLDGKLNSLTVRFRYRAPLAVAIARLTPGLLTIASVAAGTIRLHYSDFFFGIALSSVIADSFLIILGLATKNGFQLLGIEPSFWLGIVVLLVILVLAGILSYLWRRFRSSRRVS